MTRVLTFGFYTVSGAWEGVFSDFHTDFSPPAPYVKSVNFGFLFSVIMFKIV